MAHIDPSQNNELVWQLPGHEFQFCAPPRCDPVLMGILNTTPDSFSDGGRYANSASAVAHAMRLVEDGAHIIDVGGQSTRPGSEPVTAKEEIRRVLPAIEEIRRRCDVLISIDTSKAEVARQAIAAGAQIINDVTALREDPEMVEVAVRSGAAVIVMHMKGTPKTMQDAPAYEDVVGEVSAFLAARVACLKDQGVPRERLAIDPGIGFGKTVQHNLQLLANLRRLNRIGCPICVGPSRKNFIGQILGRPVTERDVGTAAVSTAAYLRGAHILRVHDVRAVRDAVAMTRAIEQSGGSL